MIFNNRSFLAEHSESVLDFYDHSFLVEPLQKYSRLL